jgi:TolB-like protein/Tfp pilus assembly protein PilF
MRLLDELKRRNVFRAAVLYAGAVWAFGQGLSQFSPAIGLPDWTTRGFLIAAGIGFPFWIAFAWFYEFTPNGLKRESEIVPEDSIARSTGRKLDFWIIGILAIVVVLLLTDRFLAHDKPAAPPIAERSIAVLPFANEGGDSDQQYFSDGLSEDFTNALLQFSGLKVIGRHSAFQFRDSTDSAQKIGAKLGVAHLLEGSVRHAGDTVRISARLIKTSDGSMVWSERYDRPYKNLFALQDEITRAIASALQAKLLESGSAVVQSDRPPGGDLEAYTAYLQGKFYNTRGTEADLRLAVAQHELAIKIDRRYAQAWAALGHMWTSLGVAFLSGQEAQEAYRTARAAANTALLIDPNLAAGHVARGYVMLVADFDWAGAQAEYQLAEQLAPNDPVSSFYLGSALATWGQLERAVELSRVALANDPLHVNWYHWLAAYLAGQGRLDEAAAASQRAVELQPAAVSYHSRLSAIEIQRGNADAAMTAAQAEPVDGGFHEIALTLALQIGPDPAAAKAALDQLIATQAEVAPFQIAEAYALRRDPDEMFAWLERAWATRDGGMQSLLYNPFILRYQHDPRFALFCEKVGLPDVTEGKAMP